MTFLSPWACSSTGKLRTIRRSRTLTIKPPKKLLPAPLRASRRRPPSRRRRARCTRRSLPIDRREVAATILFLASLSWLHWERVNQIFMRGQVFQREAPILETENGPRRDEADGA